MVYGRTPTKEIDMTHLIVKTAREVNVYDTIRIPWFYKENELYKIILKDTHPQEDTVRFDVEPLDDTIVNPLSSLTVHSDFSIAVLE
jgi:hypothetical protein